MDTEGNWNVTGSPSEAGSQNIGQEARNTAEKARSQIQSLAESGREELAEQFGGLGRALKSAGDKLRSEERAQAGHYSEMLGDQVERVGRYLNEHDTNALIGEVEGFARRQPMIFLGGCVALGFVLGRFFKASPVRGESAQMPRGVTGEGHRTDQQELAGAPSYAPSYASGGFTTERVVTTTTMPAGEPLEPIIPPAREFGPDDEER